VPQAAGLPIGLGEIGPRAGLALLGRMLGSEAAGPGPPCAPIPGAECWAGEAVRTLQDCPQPGPDPVERPWAVHLRHTLQIAL
jgi:hypothetical protein